MIEFNHTELALLREALELAIEDQVHYIKHGDPEVDFEGELLEAIKSRPDNFRALINKIDGVTA